MSITLLIIILTVGITYIAQPGSAAFYRLLHNPYQEARNGEWYRLLTSGFLHGNLGGGSGPWLHLGLNMFVLYQFGEFVEYRFVDHFGPTMGRVNYLLLYLLTIVAANLGTFFQYRDQPNFSSVGASGAVSGIILVFVIFQPWSMLLLFFVIPCPAIVAAVLFLAYSSYAGKRGGSHIDHLAHFYGAVFGFGFTILLEPEWLGYFVRQLINGAPF